MSLTTDFTSLGSTLTESTDYYHSKVLLQHKPTSPPSTLPPPPNILSSSRIPQSLLFTHLFSFALFGNNNSESNSTSAEFDLNKQYSSSSTPLSVSSSFPSSSSPSAMVLASPSYQRVPSVLNSKRLQFKTQKLPVKPPPEEDTLTLINDILATYFDPVAFGVGILGNCLLCLVFLLTPLRVRPLSHVLSGLGIIDFVYVISCLMVYLSSKGKPVYNAPGACNVTMFAAMLSRTLQSWYMLIAHIGKYRLSGKRNTGSFILSLVIE